MPTLGANAANTDYMVRLSIFDEDIGTDDRMGEAKMDWAVRGGADIDAPARVAGSLVHL